MKQDTGFLLRLPQQHILYHTLPCSIRPWLLISGGRAPEASWMRQLTGYDVCWAADHGIDFCHETGLVPDHLIGDGDSARPDAWSWAESHAVPTERYPAAKDFTDTQLAVRKIKSEGAAFLILTGVFGGRTDHLFSTLFSTASAKLPCCLADEKESALFVQSGQSVSVQFLRRPKAVSLLPISRQCSGVTIDHVRWPLNQAVLTQSFPQAISNELSTEENTIHLSVSTGTLCLYCCWEE
ncbi:thiamine diphosphokinase [Selenomonas montiformis]|uniref:Thiamine diphosphokinase n=1 Tax=Selenomonas montiformis TaxID=2652285 RepID=A0A6I2UT92_9FIRM|nr:thiamine diphosphokinase [Selenomonas montiformis]MDY4696690.1 thiamine diphosphokinase [Selenomonas montiformis]MSV25438.1 thiamine diphosphokinase [Selenomonas montiformis]